MDRIKNQSNVRLFFTLPWTLRDYELFNMSTDVNTYVYLVFLRMSLRFFLVLGIVNCLILIPLYTTGTAQRELYKTILPQIQRTTIANVIGEDLRLVFSFLVGVLNWLALCIFIYQFKARVEEISTKFNHNKYEDRDVMAASQSLMI